MPDWLLKKDIYIPLKDKDTFINKSILSLLRVLSKLNLQSEKRKNVIKINPIIKVVSTLLLVLLITTSRSSLFILTINILLLFLISSLKLDEIKTILGTSFISAAFTFIILIPSIFTGNVNNSILMVFKVLASITSVNILSHLTHWNEITGTFKLFFIPDIFIFVLDITIKYIIVLGEFSLNMLHALRLRSIGRSNNKYSSLTGIMGTIFMKSKEMAEDMHSAMECRGFTGEYKAYSNFKVTYSDLCYIIIFVIIVLLYILF
ncbi:MAG: energy-coupling factor transporter transmembrane protein EcfT [Clostridiaceae bacterium]|nr:energy-coupling factor transporter transmembrane protein EcfT [Clostridiaceae bacterium]